ncbi:MAG: tRNA guanosine(34) transglycosylase Tgt [Bacillota bacterium]|nr:tRNA guanosine(34) transglycosylase Tgt [Bacillota bacterium]
MRPRWRLLARDRSSRARAGVLETAHGEVPTPAFMPVGTLGAVRTLAPWEVEATGTRMLLANTYHLFLRPGAERVARAGGLHAFMGWEHAVLTDSGGYQVMSLAPLRRIDEDGVTFRSHIDGSLQRLTPEVAVAVQEQLGSDVAMVLDVCPPYGAPAEELEEAVRLTGAWAARARRVHRRPDQALFGIIQGGVDLELRRRSTEQVTALDFHGYALGGLSVGEPKELMLRTLEEVIPWLPEDRPRYLMGVGTPLDLLEGVRRGVDLFDCVEPARVARHGTAWTREGALRLLNRRFADDFRPLDPACTCSTCRHFSRAYLRHLLKVGEALARRLLTLHNITFTQDIVAGLRKDIIEGRKLGEGWFSWRETGLQGED